MKKIVLVLSIFFSYGYAIAESQYSYEELIEIQSVLLDSYSSESDESIAISLSNVSYKIAENLIQDFIANKDPSSIKDAIDSLDISISIFPNNKKFYLLKGDLLYLIRKYDTFYLDAMRAYEDSEDAIFESKKSFVALIDLYTNQELYSEAVFLIRKMLSFDAPWLLNEFFDMTITLTVLANNQSKMLESLDFVADQYTIEIPNVYLAKSYLSLSLNDYESVKSSHAKYEAAKVFSKDAKTSIQAGTISNYLKMKAETNE